MNCKCVNYFIACLTVYIEDSSKCRPCLQIYLPYLQCRAGSTGSQLTRPGVGGIESDRDVSARGGGETGSGGASVATVWGGGDGGWARSTGCPLTRPDYRGWRCLGSLIVKFF